MTAGAAPLRQLPAATARALLAGFGALGLPAEVLRDAAGIREEDLAPLDALVPGAAFGALWREAFRRAPREELPTEVGLAIPFGAFGALDYLAASAPTVRAAFEALASHFRYVAIGFSLELVEAGGGEVRLVPAAPFEGREVSDEMTLAIFVSRFRGVVSGPFAREVRLSRPAPARPTRHAELLGAPVAFGHAVAALRVAPGAWSAPMPSSDPALQATLRQIAARLDLGAAADDLELAVRARLRTLLPEGRGDAAQVARSLGLSERTLQRRMREAGRTFREVLEAFREAEAERLIGAGRLPLGEIALQLGFSDQTAWNRAFRRWKGMSPTDWAQARAGPRAQRP